MNGGRIIGRVVTANVVPNAKPSPELLQELNKDEGEPTRKLTTEERQELLMQVLKGYAKIAKPLQDLISDDNSKLKQTTTESKVYDSTSFGICRL